MNVQAISGSGFSSTTDAARMSQLQRQAQSLQRQITNERQSSDDEKTKALKIQQLQIKLQALEKQIQQLIEKSWRKHHGKRNISRPARRPDLCICKKPALVRALCFSSMLSIHERIDRMIVHPAQEEVFSPDRRFLFNNHRHTISRFQ